MIKTALGLGLTFPNILIAIFTLKKYFGNMRMESETSNVTRANEESLQIENGRSKNHVEIPKKERMWKEKWKDNIAGHCQARGWNVKNVRNEICEITKNLIIMDLAGQYIKHKSNGEKNKNDKPCAIT